jgi:hypothetical protein
MEKIKINKYRLKEALGKQDMTMSDLASNMGCTTASIYNWLADGFDKDRIKKIVEVTGYSRQKLQGGM